MTSDPFYKAHWIDIDPDRMAAYRDGFAWDAATERLFAPAQIKTGQTVADFGCGPGQVAVELARQVGPSGHVYAFDINAEFLDIACGAARTLHVEDQLTAARSDGTSLPVADQSLDRIVTRNAIMYVDDPVATLREFSRTLRPQGIAHVIEGDWYMMVAEPIDPARWHTFVHAAAHACRNADMGRKLYAAFQAAGFVSVEVRIDAAPDVDGRLLGTIRNMAKYAVQSSKVSDEFAQSVVKDIEDGLSAGTYFVVSPRFVVTGFKP